MRVRLSQEYLEEKTDKEISDLIGKKAKDDSELELKDVVIDSVTKNNRGYEVRVRTSTGVGEYTFMKDMTQKLIVTQNIF